MTPLHSKSIQQTPSIDTVERVLYITVREEFDAIHNHVLPQCFPKDYLLHVQFLNHRLYITSFPEVKVMGTPVASVDAVLHELAEQRAWYFRWAGNGIGPILLPRSMVALYANDAMVTRTIPNKTTLKHRLLEMDRLFLDRHLYAPVRKRKAA